ncbi:SHOCT domain-containing protein [Segeticoccus rhizosphaerae]|uniref:SHOCT domain-containing protein n=1 Tax=Segeticoccus rhizosphaerae TaxID=1104777 RepID=UPI00192E50A4|nr:SHOCT domain-containing protein [Ornithinicoccus soli]
MGGMMGGGLMGAMGFWMLLWALAGVAVLAALAAGIVWLVHRTATAGIGRGSVDSDAVQILKRRYAAGEIDGGEYARRLTVLNPWE